MKSKINEKDVFDLAELFKVFGDSTRIRILLLLFDSKISVNEIADKLNMSQSAISHQLKKLKTSSLIKNERVGQTIYYSLDDDHVYNIIKQGLEHIKE